MPEAEINRAAARFWLALGLILLGIALAIGTHAWVRHRRSAGPPPLMTLDEALALGGRSWVELRGLKWQCATSIPNGKRRDYLVSDGARSVSVHGVSKCPGDLPLVGIFEATPERRARWLREHGFVVPVASLRADEREDLFYEICVALIAGLLGAAQFLLGERVHRAAKLRL